jgi:DNA-binding LytR/AlgR family response regulator
MSGKTITCLAVDDEPPALEVLKKYISAVPHLQLVQTCANALEALAVLQHHSIDLLFMDIQMPQILGTDFIRTLKKAPKVIFTTAHQKFALEGFDLDAVDYLLKPLSFERFLKAVNKVTEVLSNEDSTPAKNDLQEKKNIPDTYLSFRSDRRMVKVTLHDILYIESLKEYIKVVTPGKNIITRQSISSIEEMLPKDLFIRIHRSYIIALSKVEWYTNELVWVAKQELPISRMYRLAAVQMLQQK